MRKFQKKQKWEYFVQSKPVLVLLFLLIVLFSWNIIKLFNKMQDTYKNKKLEQEKIVNLEQRKEKLSSDIEKLGTDKGKEEIIRENFGMVKKGEEVIVIVDDKKENQESKESEGSSFWDFFKKMF